MATSFNSIVNFNSTLWDKHQIGSRSFSGVSILKVSQFKSSSGAFGSRKLIKGRDLGFYRLSANIDRLTTKTSEKDPENSKISFPFDQNSTENLKVQSNSQNKSIPQSSEACNESTVELNPKETSSSAKPKRSSLTARERLRAARVLSRYNETKPSRSDMGKVLDAIKESERGKKKGLPEAPGNLFDDSNRGLSKPGFNFEFPGGNDLFIIVFSFVFISTVMFATTYIVWKVGAIHFNDY